MMIEQICDFIHNYFVYGRESGTFEIKDGGITLDLVAGQYFRIMGSRFNDGVYKYPADMLVDETFEGEIWEMRPPRAFLMLVDEIEAWNAKYGEYINSPYTSESFGGYSYSKSAGATAQGSMPMGWQANFASRLKAYRKLA